MGGIPPIGVQVDGHLLQGRVDRHLLIQGEQFQHDQRRTGRHRQPQLHIVGAGPVPGHQHDAHTGGVAKDGRGQVRHHDAHPWGEGRAQPRGDIAALP